MRAAFVPLSHLSHSVPLVPPVPGITDHWTVRPRTAEVMRYARYHPKLKSIRLPLFEPINAVPSTMGNRLGQPWDSWDKWDTWDSWDSRTNGTAGQRRCGSEISQPWRGRADLICAFNPSRAQRGCGSKYPYPNLLVAGVEPVTLWSTDNSMESLGYCEIDRAAGGHRQ
jgi:hypothetical protein